MLPEQNERKGTRGTSLLSTIRAARLGGILLVTSVVLLVMSINLGLFVSPLALYIFGTLAVIVSITGASLSIADHGKTNQSDAKASPR